MLGELRIPALVVDATDEDAYRGYDEKEKKFVLKPSYGLLEGIAGIGLVYLSRLQDSKPDWDIIFQTNI